MIQTKDVMASLPLVASILGDKYGVKVSVGGDRACTDGNTIILPTLPLDCDAQLLALARGFVDHEAGHIRHTNFQLLQESKLSPLQKHLWNTLEDWRCENALAAIFPGCRQHFRWLIDHHFGQDTSKAGGNNPALSVLNYVLYTVRAWDVPSIEKPRLHAASIVQKAYPGLTDALDSILTRVQQHSPDTQATISYALEMAAIIEQYAQSKPSPQKQSKPQEDSTNSASQSEEGTCSDSQADSQQASPSSAPGAQAHGRTDARRQLQKMLQADEEDLPKHMGEQLASALSAQSVPTVHGIRVANTGIKHVSALPQHALEESLRNSRALRTRLHGLLQAKTQQPCVVGRRGKLHAPRLYGLVTHNPRVFLKRGEKKEVSTAVHILLDCSGSMGGYKMELACRACFAVATALYQCSGVNVGVTAFPVGSRTDGIAVYPMLKHGDRMHNNFQTSAMGFTPLAEALWWVLQNMHPLKEDRKIILILSDGMPDSVMAARHAVDHAKMLGFEVMGLGIQDNSMEMLLPAHSKVIHDLASLPPVMFTMLQQALLHSQGESR